MGEAILEAIFSGIIESLPKFLGTTIRWFFYLGKKSFSTVAKEDWNKRVGLLAIAFIILIIVTIYY
ncbi:hypothetical protein [uncultured Winogradskyella sp.]|uniref:hypothetical protein n=1 Tax=uncultured Winogradskyella sp. TaxID=395353 RepID=UPI00263817EC|nr:hypothetical protein [uncultured Winogradskyella sp.]